MEEPKPSELLLHYNYGTAAIKMWGHGIEVLRENAQHPRPPTPKDVEMGPSRTTHERMTARQKLAEPGVEDKVEWDEDDVMLFLWSNTAAARERRRMKAEESAEIMERWREGVDQASV